MEYPIVTNNGILDIGHRPGVKFIEKFGRNTAVASGTAEDIWDVGGTYVFPTTARKLNIVSTSIQDDDAANGTGAHVVEVQGLNENWELTVEEVILDGTVAVATTNTFIRVFRVRVVHSGTGGTNAGVISVTSQVDGYTLAQIRAGIGQTNMAIYTIPAGYWGFLKKWYATINRSTGVTATAADVDLFNRSFGSDAFRSTQPVGIQNTGQGHWQYEYVHPLQYNEKTDLVVVGVPTANADISAGFSLLLVPYVG